jgi:hypothetical protein
LQAQVSNQEGFFAKEWHEDCGFVTNVTRMMQQSYM